MCQTGIQVCQVHNIKMNQGLGEEMEIPIPWFIFEHPEGLVVVDGGLAAEGLAHPLDYWGPSVYVFRPVMLEHEGCVRQLSALGFKSEDVRYVVLSHLHSDHTGAAGRFPNATHIVQRREYDYAFAPDWFAAGAYVRCDFDRPDIKWQFLEGEATDDFDLFGDGSFRVVFTPGHSVGHQSFLVKIPHCRPMLLAIDAVYTMDHWNEKALPGFLTSTVDTVRSVRKLKAVAERENAMLVPGHDPDTWSSFKHAPNFYG